MKDSFLTKDYWIKKISYARNRHQLSKYGICPGKSFSVYGKMIVSCETLRKEKVKFPSISIGESVRINSRIESNLIGGDAKTILRTIDDGKIRIGNNVGISNSTLVAMSEIVIENDVMIGGGVHIYDTDFHPIDYEDRISFNHEKIRSKGITVKEGAFIGAGSIILKGVVIGKHSIIGAGSVVRESVPDNEIWAGNPARCVRKL